MTMLKVKTGQLLGGIDDLKEEIYEYIDVLKGDESSPLDGGLMDLQELATAYYIRAKEIEIMILDGEADNDIDKSYTKFRTGMLRSSIDLFKAAKDLGSRRLTAAKDQFEDFMRG